MSDRSREADPLRRSEALLVERLCRRDVRALEQLYKASHGRMSGFLLNMLRRPELVEEVLNDTMMVVWNKIGDFQGASKLSTWMFGIAYRQGLAALRRLDEPVDEDRSAASDEATPEQRAAEGWSRAALAKAIDRLSPAQRAVVNLTYFQECGYREIAQILDCPVDTVKTRMFHARRHLKQSLSGALADWI